MREIKFRAWKKYDNSMQPWNVIQNYNFVAFTDPNYILMQYTGLKDKNGKEIYEGDIVKEIISFPDFYREERYEIKYSDSSFDCRCKGGGKYSIKYKELEIIGNIHENPELLDS